VELAGARLALRDWPGRAGPLFHVPDPLAPDDQLLVALADHFAPRYRVLSLTPARDQPYQVAADQLVATLTQFGFLSPTLIAERGGGVAALVAAAWHPNRVDRLVLVDFSLTATSNNTSLTTQALRDCPPDTQALRDRIQCPLLELRADAQTLARLEDFVS
jgi:pimeloyl-ACP methyl ester carboxylesterase